MSDAGPAVNAAPRRFRLSFGWALAQQLVAMSLSFVLVWAVGLAAGIFPPPRLLGVSVTLTSMTLGTVTTVALAVWRLTLQPRPDGLAVARLVGRPVVAGWHDIEAVRPGGVGLILHLVLTVRSRRRPVVVPLRLDDLPGFADAVAEYAGEDHPLTEALWARLADG